MRGRWLTVLWSVFYGTPLVYWVGTDAYVEPKIDSDLLLGVNLSEWAGLIADGGYDTVDHVYIDSETIGGG